MIDHTGIGVADVARGCLRVVEDPIKHRHGQHDVASEDTVLPKPHQL